MPIIQCATCFKDIFILPESIDKMMKCADCKKKQDDEDEKMFKQWRS